MALKKSELYSSLWAGCDELRGGMDASEYKNYVLVLLFIKYVSDKYAGKPFAEITVPKGASFADLVALKGKASIGDDINKRIIAPLESANSLSFGGVDFADAAKLGSGKEMVERLTNLISIFENPALDFSKNRADGDDLLGDAYEFLMRHFATESGKSKGQFYTPAEVSRVIAQVLGIRDAATTNKTTVYDPTCGSGFETTPLLDAYDVYQHLMDYWAEKMQDDCYLTGEQKAVFDLAWPNGIQEELSQPVAVLLNESTEMIGVASQAGYRCFTTVDEFKRYVNGEILVAEPKA